MNYGDAYRILRKAIPALNYLDVRCPARDACYICDVPASLKYESSFLNMIVHLNDFHKMSREAIADWVELTAAELDVNLELPLPKHLQEEQ